MSNQEEHKANLNFSKEDSNYVRPVMPTRHTLRKSLWFNLPLTAYFVLALFSYYLPFRWVFLLFGGYWIFAIPLLFLLNCGAIIYSKKTSEESQRANPLALLLGAIQLLVIVFFGLSVLLS
jgi:hypothetical protein